MTNLRRRVVCFLACSAAILMCSFLFAVAAYADSIPSDPIIDTEVGGGSVPFPGQITVEYQIADNGTNCTSFNDTLDVCGLNGNFIQQFRVVTFGVDGNKSVGALVPAVLNNTSPDDITNLDFRFDTPEAPFQFKAGSIFSGPITTVSDFEAIYTLGAGKNPICSSSQSATDPNCVGNCPPPILSLNQQTAPCSASDLSLGIAGLFIRKDTGFVDLTATSNVPVPEPTSFALLVSMLPGVWAASRKLRRS